ncbi:MAG: PorV/PorQ family protein [bacterium]
MKKLIVLISILIFSQPVISYAGDDDVGICTAQFLKIGQGPRVVGMGGAGVAIADDVNATYWNPAGLVQLELREITAARTNWFEDIKTNYLAYTQSLQPINNRKRSMGVSLILLNVEGIDGRDNTGQRTTSLEVDNLALSLSYAIELRQNLAFGFNVKAIKQDLGGNKGTGMAVDIGLLSKYSKKNISFGLNIQNLGAKLKTSNAKNDLPLNIKLGACYKPQIFGEGTLLALDLDIPKDNDINFHAGVEYWLIQSLGIRLGYNQQMGYSTGLGFRSRGEGYFEGIEVQVDYGFVSHTEFDNSHRFSFITKF